MKNINKDSSISKGGSKLKLWQLYTAMAVALVFGTPKESFGQDNNKNNIVYNMEKISFDDYMTIVKQKDSILSNMSIDYMTPQEYFVYNKKKMFLKHVKENKYGISNKLNNLNRVLKNKFNLEVGNDPIESVVKALQLLAQNDSIEGMKSLSGNITSEFDMDLINTYGYIQMLFGETRNSKTGDKTPTWVLSYQTIENIIALLNNITYVISGNNSLDNEAEPEIENKPPKGENNIPKIEEDNGDLDERLNEDDTKPNKPKIDEKPTKVEEKPEIEKKPKVENNPSKVEEEPVIDQNNGDLDERLNEGNEKPKVDDKPTKVDKKTEFEEKIIEEEVIKEDVKGKTVKELEDMITFVEKRQNDINEELKSGNKSKKYKDETLKRVIRDYQKLKEEYQEQIEKLKNKSNTPKIEEEPTIVEEPEVEKKKPIIELDEEMFVDENLEIVKNISRNADILSQKLSSDKLNGISYQEIIDVVNGFKSNELKKAFMYFLLEDNIVKAQEIIGIENSCHYRYNQYKAGKKIGRSELNKIKKLGQTRRYMDQNNIMANKYIPQDVKDAYQNFVSGKYNNKGRPYSILSKTDFNIYLFSSNHRLLSRQNSLIGVDVGDQKNNPAQGSQTTPGGMYEIGTKNDKSESGEDFFEKYGTHYIILIPLNNQYTVSNNYTMGLHGTFNEDKARDTKIKSGSSVDRRESNGCINTEDDKFGEVYNHLETGGILFVTYEPTQTEINNFIESQR